MSGGFESLWGVAKKYRVSRKAVKKYSTVMR
jgi:hypothetical protein